VVTVGCTTSSSRPTVRIRIESMSRSRPVHAVQWIAFVSLAVLAAKKAFDVEHKSPLAREHRAS
jgi:hypothetical protein